MGQRLKFRHTTHCLAESGASTAPSSPRGMALRRTASRRTASRRTTSRERERESRGIESRCIESRCIEFRCIDSRSILSEETASRRTTSRRTATSRPDWCLVFVPQQPLRHGGNVRGCILQGKVNLRSRMLLRPRLTSPPVCAAVSPQTRMSIFWFGRAREDHSSHKQS